MFLSSDANPPMRWQRVVSSAGKISTRGAVAMRGAGGGRCRGDEVRVGRANELLIDLVAYGWFPASVPRAVGP
jgi:hypothetical protein